MTGSQRFLVKLAAGSAGAQLRLDGASIAMHSKPLFSSIGVSAAAPNAKAQPLAAAAQTPQSNWHIVEPIMGLNAPASPWDMCHEMVSQGMGVDGAGAVVFAEPDLVQQWFTGSDEAQLQALTQACTADKQNEGTTGFPGKPENDWYRDKDHAQFALLAKTATGAGVRIAHLDTGYDPGHTSKPVNLETSLAKNFVDSERPNDATDDTSGLWNNRGHGTGTLSILAGAPVPQVGISGVAPQAQVVPIRVANRVELFYNSAIAQAFDYVHSLCQTPATFVDVVSMSMGGLASQAWAEAINALYETGVVVVTAAGNNFNNLPTRNIVFPARFNRVVAACGVMADQQPYVNLGAGKMAGNFGPAKKMLTAMSAYTPNVPWARFGCPTTVRFDGAGTSAATPQIAGTAALYIQANRSTLSALPEPWMRGEAVRQALFDSATKLDPATIGNGALKANAALAQPVATASQLNPKRQQPDSATFGLLRVLTGLGMDAAPPGRQRMLELEALQLSQSAELEQLLPDPDDTDGLTDGQKLAILKALAEHPRASRTLRAALQPYLPNAAPSPTSATAAPSTVRTYPTPSARRLRIYSYDPSLGQSLDTFGINETVTAVRWEDDLQPGPVGEYLEVVDIDPASASCYPPVDLNDPYLLATDGLRPSEANPQFHQQMVYAVAMRTIDHFEKALGRRALWAPYFDATAAPQAHYVQRLRIYPHALRATNAYYSPEKKALLLGYFSGSESDADAADSHAVFTALSSDIVAHETTHALLDGLHRRFREPTNDDVLAFHEAFADIVALFQHFSLEGALRDQIARYRGDLSHENLLSQLAIQFGWETGHHGALRAAVGKPPEKTDYQASKEPHQRGSVLVAAVFDAFLQIYRRKALVPIRLSTGGSEVLAPGALPTELAEALAAVAATVAAQVLQMCIRAMDYSPPVDLTFGDFLRAVITADKDLVPNDPHGYRVAFASAFRARGIYPEKVRTVSVDTLSWDPPPAPLTKLGTIVSGLTLRWDLQSDRYKAWQTSRDNAYELHRSLVDPGCITDDELAMLGLHRTADPNFQVTLSNGSACVMDMRGIEVHSVRPLRRVGPDGQLLSQMIIELTQSLHAKDDSGLVVRGGCTLVVDLNHSRVTYMVRKRANLSERVERQQALWAAQSPTLRDIYRAPAGAGSEPFALLHGLY